MITHPASMITTRAKSREDTPSQINFPNTLLSREYPAGPIYTGSLPVVGGLRILASQYVPFPTSALVLDSAQLGGMADEQLGGPGYTGGIGGVESKTIRKDSNDSYDLRARRVTVPVVGEPAAAIQITGVRPDLQKISITGRS